MPIRKPENLHHLTEGKNDWDDLSDHELNFWQKVAKKTRGIITAGNAVTIAGTILVMNGFADIASGNKGVGLAKVVSGRTFDIADGEVADMTKTKGNAGRVLDPSVDFVQLMVGLPVLVNSDMLPVTAAAVVAVPKVATAVSSTVGFLRGQNTQVPEEAKLGTFGLWAGIAAFGIRAVFDKQMPGALDNTLEIIGWAGTVGGTAYQLPATKQYLEAGFGPSNPPQPPTA